MTERHKRYQITNTLRELIRDNNMLLMVLCRFNIPFGFGDSTVAQVCEKHCVSAPTFLAVCNLLSFGAANPRDVELDSLIGYLKRAHTSFLEVSLPRIRQHLIEAINYSATDRVSYLLMQFFDNYVVEVKRHMEHENEEIFVYAENLMQGRRTPGLSISKFSANHGHMAAKLQELKDLFIYHYDQAENTRLSATLFDIINCEKDLMAHFEVENRLFIPAVNLLEQTYEATQVEEGKEEGAADTSLMDVLGEREKEIIAYIAKGLANKEIADKLCISVHTVATHRRNICSKLNIHTTAGLTIFAIIHNLVDFGDNNPAINHPDLGDR